MRMPKRGEKGFTLIELLIVVAILGVLAAVIIPNISRFFGAGKQEAAETELNNVQLAVDAMMVANNIDRIPHITAALIYATGDAATNNMTTFPDIVSDDSDSTKVSDPEGGTYDFVAGDKEGYLLYGHDELADDGVTELEDYMRNSTTTYFYAIEANGKVHQYADADRTPVS